MGQFRSMRLDEINFEMIEPKVMGWMAVFHLLWTIKRQVSGSFYFSTSADANSHQMESMTLSAVMNVEWPHSSQVKSASNIFPYAGYAEC